MESADIFDMMLKEIEEEENAARKELMEAIKELNSIRASGRTCTDVSEFENVVLLYACVIALAICVFYLSYRIISFDQLLKESAKDYAIIINKLQEQILEMRLDQSKRDLVENVPLPCPFCGGQAVIKPVDEYADDDQMEYIIGCETPSCQCWEYESAIFHADKKSAIKAWNTRKYKE